MIQRGSRGMFLVMFGILAGMLALHAGCGKANPVAQNQPPVDLGPPLPEPPTPNNTNPIPQPSPQPALAPAAPAAYTLEPIEIAKEATPDVALQKMVAHYGRNRVVRIVLTFTDGPAPPQTSDWLRGVLHLFAAPGISQSAHISQQGKTATAIIGPVRNVSLLDDVFPWSVSGKQIDGATRTLTASLPVSYLPPAPGSPEETAELAKLVETLTTATDFKAKQTAQDRIKNFRSPAGAAAYCTLLQNALREQKSGWIDYVMSLKNFGPLAEKFILDWLPQGEEKGTLSKAHLIGELGDLGGQASLAELPKLAATLPPAAVEAVQETVAKIKLRMENIRKNEEQSRLDDETPHPAPISPDVKLTVNARHFWEAYIENPSDIHRKYGGQIVEVTGDLNSLSYGGVNGEPSLNLRTNVRMNLSAKGTGKYHAKNLAPGQRITVKGTVDAEGYLQIKEAVVVKAEGTPPAEMSAEAFGVEFADMAQQTAAGKKYAGQWLVITGKIVEVQGGGNYATLESGKGPKVYLALDLPDDQKKELKVGQTLVALGRFDRPDNTFEILRFADCVLCAAPQGP